MAPWPVGQQLVARMIVDGKLEHVPGDPERTEDLIATTETKLGSAQLLTRTDPDSAYTLAYDAARFLLNALLAAQGLRVKGGTEAGHSTLQDAVQAQFGDLFRFFSRMRRTRNELEFPPLTRTAETVNAEEASERIDQVRAVVQPVRELVEQLPLFR
ncbi:hypothetical protein EH165_14720 [Nakamurella antarctica]|uniref:HEPN domain-containing protein n=1 Tax=Nakamurella antarctica TaxID=1902245 RepID=A0A3G8ZYV5_9ACTN|nr:hypothetical protein [Nakamurella antarctica]AZI59206.1 hypothetical protein EH165_14720 [Nakamurella antarctica]